MELDTTEKTEKTRKKFVPKNIDVNIYVEQGYHEKWELEESKIENGSLILKYKLKQLNSYKY